MKKIMIMILGMFIFLIGSENAFALNVEQEKIEVESKSESTRVIASGIGDLVISPTLEFNVVGDFITYKLVLKNTDGKKYKIVNISDDNKNEFVKLDYSYNKELNTSNKEILITIKYNKKVSNSNVVVDSLKLIIELVDEDDNNQEVVVDGKNTNILSPKTIDNINKYFVLFIIGVIGFIFAIIFYKKNKKKSKGITTLLLLFVLLPTIVVSAAQKQVSFFVNFENVKINLKHMIVLDYDNGTEEKKYIVDDQSPVYITEMPEKYGYNFMKWIDQNGNEFNINSPVSSDMKLKAIYEKKKYSVSFDTDGGDNIDSQEVPHNDKAKEPAKPMKKGYSFIKWVNKNGDEYDFSTQVTENITLYSLSLQKLEN